MLQAVSANIQIIDTLIKWLAPIIRHYKLNIIYYLINPLDHEFPRFTILIIFIICLRYYYRHHKKSNPISEANQQQIKIENTNIIHVGKRKEYYHKRQKRNPCIYHGLKLTFSTFFG
ncbi:hypothetical protein EV207_16018 [Scopulibacillus darangshiensis]|uniref:Uncharacterized protein n=1 Tax=Scopulibacillus darangshiensis TaxID=442528 RepID=A0A4R2NEZ9_9BACL|nr:hypothetical protein EV207_16018 [Scopulibacillus darangshiensis]